MCAYAERQTTIAQSVFRANREVYSILLSVWNCTTIEDTVKKKEREIEMWHI